MKGLFDLPITHPAEFINAQQPIASTAWGELIFGGPCIFYGFSARPDGAAASLDIYDGQGAGDRRFGTYLTLATQNYSEYFYPGAFCRHGLFIDCDTHVLEVTVVFLPVFD